MRYVRHLIRVSMFVATLASPAYSQSITTLLTAEERAAAGLSKLTSSELAALDAALLRVLGELATVLGPAVAARTSTTPTDLDLYDSRGRAAAFLEPSDGLTFYLWSGEPVAYLDDESVYGFNGKHLGWYQNGAVYDHDGNVVVAPAGMFRGVVEPAPPRGLRRLKPLKGLKELRPLRPLFGTSWSAIPAAVFLMRGTD